ncbi:hypothetical protein FACS1894200_12020 [Spirochaetia bacterium]|nr:hypothetical protein FACS1894200_12020 [Spirochaetia bacterium]
MRIVRETRTGDINVRAGVIITNGILMLASQPTNMIRNGWLYDISAKGHLQNGESPLQGAIRECWEETNIKFEPWKLTHPIQTSCDGQPLFLFLALLDELIPLEKLSCVSTFIDDFDGIRKPEVESYAWINPRKHLYLFQERLRPGIQYYFSRVLIEKEIACGVDSDEIKAFIKYCNKLGKDTGERFEVVDEWPDRKSDSSDLLVAVERFEVTEMKHEMEDCQIAGRMIGSIPPNVGSVLSLGYKNGRVLSSPKRNTKAQDYSEIPRF